MKSPFVLVAFLATLSAAHAQEIDCKEQSIRQCCQGISYWAGLPAGEGKPLEVDGKPVNVVSSLASDHSTMGGLRTAEGRHAAVSVALTVVAFLLILFLMRLNARRTAVDGRILYGALVGVPGLVWWFVPMWMAESTAAETAAAFVDGTLRPFCHEARIGAGIGTGACSPSRWGDILPPEGSAKGTLAACQAMAADTEVEAERLLSSGGANDPCVRVCSEATSSLVTEPLEANRPELKGYAALTARFSLLDRLVTDCEALAGAWRSTEGPSPAVWEQCKEALAARQVRRALASPAQFVTLRAAWLGGAASFLLAGLLGLFFLRRR